MGVNGKRTIVSVLGLVLLLAAVIAGPAAGAKKKKGKRGGAAQLSKTVGQPIPDAVVSPPGTWGRLDSTITVGKKFKGKSAGDVEVTFQTTGSGPNAGYQLLGRLTAPDGTTVELFSFLHTQSIGPLTLSDHSLALTCSGAPLSPGPPPPCADPDATLLPPFAGTALHSELKGFVDAPMRGNWRLSIFDILNGESSSLVSWGLRIQPRVPVI